MALKGTLEDFSLADIFQLIGIQKKTGVLTLKRSGEVVTVTFVDGDVVTADALQRRLEDRLGVVLVKSGRLSEARLHEALRIQKNTLKRLGNVLIENKFIDVNGLRDALQVQVGQIVYRLFRWRDGEYDFSQDARPDYEKDLAVPMSAESVLMEGARILDEWPMIEKSIRSMQTVWRPANVEIGPVAARGPAAGPVDGEAAAGVTLSEEERLIHALVDGKRSVQEIVERSTVSEFDTCRILHELIGRQLLEEARSAPVRAVPGARAPERREQAAQALPPLIVGTAATILVALLAGTLYFRMQGLLAGRDRGETRGALLEALFGAADVRGMETAVARTRLQRVDRAIQAYFLVQRGFPEGLRTLVTARLLRPDGILDPWGREIGYEVTSGGYRLTLAAESQTQIQNLSD